MNIAKFGGALVNLLYPYPEIADNTMAEKEARELMILKKKSFSINIDTEKARIFLVSARKPHLVTQDMVFPFNDSPSELKMKKRGIQKSP